MKVVKEQSKFRFRGIKKYDTNGNDPFSVLNHI